MMRLLRCCGLSAAIDELWEAQIQQRKEVGVKTQDALSVFGYTDDAEDSHTTIARRTKSSANAIRANTCGMPVRMHD